MGVIIKELPVAGDLGEAQVHACFDSGSVASFIRRDIAVHIATIAPLPSPRTFSLGDGKATLQAREVVTLDVVIKGVQVFQLFIVADDLSDEMIIGADMLQRWKIRLGPETEDVDIDPRVTRLRL